MSDETVPLGDPRDRALQQLQEAKRLLGRGDVASVRTLNAIAYALLAIVDRLDLLIDRVDEVER